MKPSRVRRAVAAAVAAAGAVIVAVAAAAAAVTAAASEAATAGKRGVSFPPGYKRRRLFLKRDAGFFMAPALRSVVPNPRVRVKESRVPEMRMRRRGRFGRTDGHKLTCGGRRGTIRPETQSQGEE